jgi:AAA domain (dynein-related subfamily)
MSRKQDLLDFINTPSTSPTMAELQKDAREQLEQLERAEASANPSVDADINFAITELRKALQETAGQGAVDKKEVEDLINKELKGFKVGIKNLDTSVKELISTTQTIQVVNWQDVKVMLDGKGKPRRIFDVILSDFEAGNNVYLYGGAGTGKTYIVGEIADSINYKLITINCNQFTSPLDILGGQTIEGYQEGRLTEAWGNLFMPEINPKTGQPYSGALLLLDELPKIDPNTAGLLNDGLSKIKDPLKEKDGKIFGPTITNGRGKAIDKKKIFVIATGNSKLNEADKDYEANFKQDLSLQDRFAGSTYELIIDPAYELKNIMSGVNVNGQVTDFVFIFNFLFKLRTAIQENNYSSRAFVSTRSMVSFRDTYIAYRLNELQGDKQIPRPKTLQDAVRSFMDLFTEDQRTVLSQAIDLPQFMTLIDVKNKLPLSDLTSDMDKQEAQALIQAFDLKNANKIR